MVSLFLLLGCNLSYVVDLFAALHELASASALTLLKLASSVRAPLKPYGDTLNITQIRQKISVVMLINLGSISLPNVNARVVFFPFFFHLDHVYFRRKMKHRFKIAIGSVFKVKT